MIHSNPNQVVSIIIGRNEGDRLERAFQSVEHAGIRSIYVDSASTDNSIEIAKRHGIPYIELSQDTPLSAARARNAGFKWVLDNHPDAKYVHLLDGDCTLDPSWLDAAVNVLDQNSELAAVTGRLRERDLDKSVYAKLSDMGWYIRPGEILSAGGIVTVKRQAFEEVDGFDETLIAGEEPEFYLRLRKAGYKLRCLEQEIGTHDSNISSYSEWWKRTIRTGFSYANAAEWGRWQRERRSLVVWGGILPCSIAVSFFFSTLLAVLLAFLYPLQIVRVFFKMKIPYGPADRLLFAFFCVIDKIPEFLGFLKYHYARVTGRKQEIIEYKSRGDSN